MTDRAHPLIAIVGPTGSGKSALALRLARELAGEIVSCDSLQVYRGLDIGSAKATAAERAEVRHHLLDVVEPGEEFSAAEYARQGRAALIEIAARGRLPLVAGGTGLYLKALLQGLFEGPARNEPLRRRLEALAERYGDTRLHRLLGRVDPESAARLAARDRVRIIRALEVFWTTGRPLTALHREGARPLRGFATLVLGLAPDRADLRLRVEQRAREMFEGGLLDEVRALLDRGLPPEPAASPCDRLSTGGSGRPRAAKPRRRSARDGGGDPPVRQAPDDLVPAPGPGDVVQRRRRGRPRRRCVVEGHEERS